MHYGHIHYATLLGLATIVAFNGRGHCRDEPERSSGPRNSATKPWVEKILWWLPVDTQTVVVDEQPSKFLTRSGGGRDGVDEAAGPPWPPSVFRAGGPHHRLADQTVVLRVEGSRRFRMPRDLGLMPYEGATIAVFEHDLDEQVTASVHEGATRTEMIEGRRVSMFRKRFERDDWTLFITQPRPNILIGATHRGYLADLLGRMTTRGPSRALPDALPEWRQLDKTARSWGIRHYDPKDAALDATSPLSPRDCLGFRDDHAIGLVFTLDRTKRATVKYLLGHGDAGRIVAKYWQNEAFETKPQVRQTAPGVFEISNTMREGGADDFFLLLLFGALGHAVCL